MSIKNTFKQIPLANGTLIDPEVYLPGSGNYKDHCKDFRVISCLPNYEKPTYCIMEAKCPKTLADGSIKYYSARAYYNIANDKVDTDLDGHLIVSQK